LGGAAGPLVSNDEALQQFATDNNVRIRQFTTRDGEAKLWVEPLRTEFASNDEKEAYEQSLLASLPPDLKAQYGDDNILIGRQAESEISEQWSNRVTGGENIERFDPVPDSDTMRAAVDVALNTFFDNNPQYDQPLLRTELSAELMAAAASDNYIDLLGSNGELDPQKVADFVRNNALNDGGFYPNLIEHTLAKQGVTIGEDGALVTPEGVTLVDVLNNFQTELTQALEGDLTPDQIQTFLAEPMEALTQTTGFYERFAAEQLGEYGVTYDDNGNLITPEGTVVPPAAEYYDDSIGFFEQLRNSTLQDEEKFQLINQLLQPGGEFHDLVEFDGERNKNINKKLVSYLAGNFNDPEAVREAVQFFAGPDAQAKADRWMEFAQRIQTFEQNRVAGYQAEYDPLPDGQEPNKILVTYQGGGGGHKSAAEALKAELEAQGYEVELVARDPEDFTLGVTNSFDESGKLIGGLEEEAFFNYVDQKGINPFTGQPIVSEMDRKIASDMFAALRAETDKYYTPNFNQKLTQMAADPNVLGVINTSPGQYGTNQAALANGKFHTTYATDYGDVDELAIKMLTGDPELTTIMMPNDNVESNQRLLDALKENITAIPGSTPASSTPPERAQRQAANAQLIADLEAALELDRTNPVTDGPSHFMQALSAQTNGLVQTGGYPVRDGIRPIFDTKRTEFREQLGMEENDKLVVLSFGSQGKTEATKEAMQQVLNYVPPEGSVIGNITLMPLTGKNAQLQAELQALYDAAPPEVKARVTLIFPDDPSAFGEKFLNPEQMSKVLGTADVFMSKPGGSATAEFLTAGTPVLLSNSNPSEAGNMEHLVASGLGADASGMDEAGVHALMTLYFTDRPQLNDSHQPVDWKTEAGEMAERWQLASLSDEALMARYGDIPGDIAQSVVLEGQGEDDVSIRDQVLANLRAQAQADPDFMALDPVTQDYVLEQIADDLIQKQIDQTIAATLRPTIERLQQLHPDMSTDSAEFKALLENEFIFMLDTTNTNRDTTFGEMLSPKQFVVITEAYSDAGAFNADMQVVLAEGLDGNVLLAHGLQDDGELQESIYSQFAALYDGEFPQDTAVPPDPEFAKNALQAELDALVNQLSEEAQQALDQMMRIQTGVSGENIPYDQLDEALHEIRTILGAELEGATDSSVVAFMNEQLAQLPTSADEHLANLTKDALDAAPEGTWTALHIDPANADAALQAFLSSASPAEKQAVYAALSTSKVLSATPWLFDDASKADALSNAQEALAAVGSFPLLQAVVGRVEARLDGSIDGLTPQKLADQSAANMIAYLEQENPALLNNMLEGTTREALEAEFSEYLLGIYENPKLPLENRQGFFGFLSNVSAYLANTLSDAAKTAFQTSMQLAGSIMNIIPFGPELKAGYALGQQYVQALRTSNAAASAGAGPYDSTEQPLTVDDFEWPEDSEFDPSATYSVGHPATDKTWDQMNNDEKRTLAQRLGGNRKENVGNQFDPNRDEPISGTMDIGPGQYTKIEAYLQQGFGTGKTYGNLEEDGYEIRLDAEHGLVAYFSAEGGMESGNTFKVALTAGVSNAVSVSFGADFHDQGQDIGGGVFGSAQAGPSAAFIGEVFVGGGGVGLEGVVGYTLAEVEFGGHVTLGPACLNAHGELNTGFGFGLGTTVEYDQDTGVLTVELNLEVTIFCGIEVGFELQIDINKIRGIDPPEERFLAPSFNRQTSGSGNDTFHVPPLSPPGGSEFQVFYVDGQGGEDELILPGYSEDWTKSPLTGDPHGAKSVYVHSKTGDRVYTIDVEEVRYEKYSFQDLEPSVQAKADEYYEANKNRFTNHNNVYDAMIDFFSGGPKSIGVLAQSFGGGGSGNMFNLDGTDYSDNNIDDPNFHDFITNYLGANVESVLEQFDANKDGMFSQEDAILFVEHLRAVDQTDAMLANFDDPTSDEARFAQELASVGAAVTPELIKELAEKMAVDGNAPENVIALRNAVLNGDMDPADALILLSGRAPLDWVEQQGLNPLADRQYHNALMDALVLNGAQSTPVYSTGAMFAKAREFMGEEAFQFGSLASDYSALLAVRRDGLNSGNPTPDTDSLNQPLNEWLPMTAQQEQAWRQGLGLQDQEPFPSVKDYLGLNEEQMKTLEHFEANGFDVKGLVLKTFATPELTAAHLRHNIDTVMQLMVINGEDNTDEILFSFLETGNSNDLVTQSRAELDEQQLAETIVKDGVQGIEGGPDFQTRIDALAQSNPAEYERFMEYAQDYFDIKKMLEGPDAKFTEADIDLILHNLKDGDDNAIGGLNWPAIHEALVAHGGGAPGSLSQYNLDMSGFVNDLAWALPDTTYSDFETGTYERDYSGLAWQALSAHINNGQPYSNDGGNKIDNLIAAYTVEGPPFYESTSLNLSTGGKFGPVDFIKGAFEVFNFGDNRQGLNSTEFDSFLGNIGKAKNNIAQAQADGLVTIVEESRAEQLARARNEAFMGDLDQTFFDKLYNYVWRGDDIYTWHDVSQELGINDMSLYTQKMLKEAFDTFAQSQDTTGFDGTGYVDANNVGGSGVNESQYRDFVQSVLGLRQDAFEATGFEPHPGAEDVTGDYKFSNEQWPAEQARREDVAFIDALNNTFHHNLYNFNIPGNQQNLPLNQQYWDGVKTWDDVSAALGINNMPESVQNKLRDIFYNHAKTRDPHGDGDGFFGGMGVNHKDYRGFVAAVEQELATVRGRRPEHTAPNITANGPLTVSAAEWQAEQDRLEVENDLKMLAREGFLHYLQDYTHWEDPNFEEFEGYFNMAGNGYPADLRAELRTIFNRVADGNSDAYGNPALDISDGDVGRLISEIKSWISGKLNAARRNWNWLNQQPADHSLGQHPPGSNPTSQPVVNQDPGGLSLF
jgi:hypothetical protein